MKRSIVVNERVPQIFLGILDCSNSHRKLIDSVITTFNKLKKIESDVNNYRKVKKRNKGFTSHKVVYVVFCGSSGIVFATQGSQNRQGTHLLIKIVYRLDVLQVALDKFHYIFVYCSGQTVA